jgi:K+-transporting ATPase KdpF subunit
MSLENVVIGLVALDIMAYLAITLRVSIAKPLGRHPTRRLEGRRPQLSPVLRSLDRPISSISGADEQRKEERRESEWKTYAVAALLCALVSMLVFALLVVFVYAYGWLAAAAREVGMGIEYVVVGLIALGIAIYLMIALLRPDKF